MKTKNLQANGTKEHKLIELRILSNSHDRVKSKHSKSIRSILMAAHLSWICWNLWQWLSVMVR